MAIDPQEFTHLLGAEIVGEVPDVGGGPFGMARLAHIMHQRLTPSQGERPGRPTNPDWASRPKVPMSEATSKKLAAIAAAMSTPQRKISPMQVAAQLLEEAVREYKRQRTCGASERQFHDSAHEPMEPPPARRVKTSHRILTPFFRRHRFGNGGIGGIVFSCVRSSSRITSMPRLS